LENFRKRVTKEEKPIGCYRGGDVPGVNAGLPKLDHATFTWVPNKGKENKVAQRQ